MNFAEIQQLLNSDEPYSQDGLNETFKDFQTLIKATNEGSVMQRVVPLITGRSNISSGSNVKFTNMVNITGNETAALIPDFFDGVENNSIERAVREDLNNMIVPHLDLEVPRAPNFFFEVKGPSGVFRVVRGQAMLDGAYGARAMHSLQNYLREETSYDGKAYAFTAAFLSGYLELYAHHVTAGDDSRPGPHYHMTRIKTYNLDEAENFHAGIKAFRNLREKAREYRDLFIQRANQRARAGVE